MPPLHEMCHLTGIVHCDGSSSKVPWPLGPGLQFVVDWPQGICVFSCPSPHERSCKVWLANVSKTHRDQRINCCVSCPTKLIPEDMNLLLSKNFGALAFTMSSALCATECKLTVQWKKCFGRLNGFLQRQHTYHGRQPQTSEKRSEKLFFWHQLSGKGQFSPWIDTEFVGVSNERRNCLVIEGGH